MVGDVLIEEFLSAILSYLTIVFNFGSKEFLALSFKCMFLRLKFFEIFLASAMETSAIKKPLGSGILFPVDTLGVVVTQFLVKDLLEIRPTHVEETTVFSRG